MKFKKLVYLQIFLFMSLGCERFLNEKSDLSLATPETLEENQALLDRSIDNNENFAVSGLLSSDDVYLTSDDYNGLDYEEDKRLYVWQPDHVAVSQSEGNDWVSCFRGIYIANSVLYNIEHYKIKNADNVKGQAFFFRGIRYLDAAQIWCLAYDPAKADNILGLPLRLDPNMNTPSVRSTLRETYIQIISDLKIAADLLPNSQVALSCPTKAAAWAFLARAYLYIGDYSNALEYAKRVLDINSALMDFNDLSFADLFPISLNNEEVLVFSNMRFTSIVNANSSYAKIDKDIYDSYDTNDLRKYVYFKENADGAIVFNGSYAAQEYVISSTISKDELYLIAAEAYAQGNNIPMALDMLNTLLLKRWKQDTYIPYASNSKTEVLEIISKERRKELIFRGTRWADIKRYNRDGANITLTRIINNNIYSLPANDLRFAIAIPEEVIKVSNMVQNPR